MTRDPAEFGWHCWSDTPILPSLPQFKSLHGCHLPYCPYHTVASIRQPHGNNRCQSELCHNRLPLIPIPGTLTFFPHIHPPVIQGSLCLFLSAPSHTKPMHPSPSYKTYIHSHTFCSLSYYNHAHSKAPQLEFGEKLIFTQLPLLCVVSEEFSMGGVGDSQSPRPIPFSCLLRHTENTLALLLWCYCPPPQCNALNLKCPTAPKRLATVYGDN